MEIKKNPAVDLRNKKSIFFLSGLLISQAFVLGAFTYTQYEKQQEAVVKQVINEEVEVIENTEQVYTPPPPPPPPNIEIAENDEDADDFEAPDTEFDKDTDVAPPPPPPPPPSQTTNESKIFEVVEVNPAFKGGHDAMMAFIGKNFKYPDEAKRFDITGRVLISFVVDEEGRITEVRPLLPPDKQLGYGLEEEAMKVVRMMSGMWTPGKQRNTPVKVRYTLPFYCTLDN
jgi:protein TonB